MTITHAQYPLCSKLGVLRQGKTHLTISTTALLAAVGWEKYKTYLQFMKHYRGNWAVTPESCEKWLSL